MRWSGSLDPDTYAQGFSMTPKERTASLGIRAASLDSEIIVVVCWMHLRRTLDEGNPPQASKSPSSAVPGLGMVDECSARDAGAVGVVVLLNESVKRKEHGRGSPAGEEKGFDDVGSNICLLVPGRLFIGPVTNVDAPSSSSYHHHSMACSWQCPPVSSLYLNLLLQDGSLSYSEDQSNLGSVYWNFGMISFRIVEWINQI
ncbi:hypothetical protein EDD85DRAFT_785222 [Armillaria nabsnona]|nr:hypothetical protein EDD85DRAFT_785222 [Armillaria nabsnona]